MNLSDLLGSSIAGGIVGGIVSYILAKHKYQQLDLTRYIDTQFPIYRKLWSNIYSLKVGADMLWDEAIIKNLRNFADQLEKTEKIINSNIIIIEKQHVIELKRLFGEFWSFKVGKDSLIEIRKHQEKYNDINDDEVKILIDRNGRVKKSYDELIEVLEESFRNQIKFPRLLQ